jgi:plastocyanin
MRGIKAAVLMAAVLVAAAPAGAQEGFDGSIAITAEGYSPRDVVVTVGSTVVWTNTGGQPASVTGAGAAAFDSSPLCTMERTDVCLRPDGTFARTVTEPGTIVYRDRITNATGVLRVVAADAPDAPPPVDGMAVTAGDAAALDTAATDGTDATDGTAATDGTDATAESGLPRTGGGAAGVLGLGLLAGAGILHGRRRR